MAHLIASPWAVWLDSGHPMSPQGRFDILSADPAITLVTRGETTEWRSASGIYLSSDEPLRLLAEALGPRRSGIRGLPFIGGAIGYFSYDLGRQLMGLPRRSPTADALPEMAIGIYDWALILDHKRQRAALVGRDEARLRDWGARWRAELGSAGVSSANHSPSRTPVAAEPPVPPAGIAPNLTRAAYLAAVGRIRDYLATGDCYQVNLAVRFSAPRKDDPWLSYQRLRALNPAPFAAYLQTPEVQILCSSPERFLRVGADGIVETKPIKGTRPRALDPREDAYLAESLRLSPKDRAENLMIVDLLRNDLGKVCALGSVQVPGLFAIERFARVQHLVSTVTGRLAEGQTAIDLLRAAFPGGSITGAPKRRAMEIIDELEPHPRGVYCGAIGYLGFDGAMDTNIAIRTLVYTPDRIHLWAGGGIVFDSDPEAEYGELLHKAAPLFDLLE
ncbi:aminodeoxychorismate synthase component I [Caldichromatium japonicum]|uniref:aminodeoxychorismate synthase n=2 Tax=Caldichromatium japonicum TaxID=2699430 RepID=A0A6G7VGK6_9GAMM|nr:aminodeoxychorismate synthase component I [Caldichromatium japonicum]